MSLQLIFVVETNNKCKSDWIYIKDTIEYFYHYNQAQTKLSVVYMDGKGKYKNKEKEILNLVTQYALQSKESQSKVIYCFDCDNYDIKQEDSEFLKSVKQYCDSKEADFVWFCKDIERVYLNKKVDDNQKKKEATIFKMKRLVNNIDTKKLCYSNYQSNTSNIMLILDKYLERK